MGSYMWPVACIFLLFGAMLPAVAIVATGERLKRVLMAFGTLFNAVLAQYLGLIQLFRERNFPLVAIFALSLAVSFAGAIAAVILAFFDSGSTVAASELIQQLIGPVVNYMFATVLGVGMLEKRSTEKHIDDETGTLVGRESWRMFNLAPKLGGRKETMASA
jgi:hypothetical protein